MSDKTSIEWTDRTWNPLTGCTKVSPGCDHCYAKTMHERFNGPGSFDTVTLHPARLAQPFRWRPPSLVFVNSMSDLFHQDVPDEFIAQVFSVMRRTPKHTYQVLTKRHARMRSLLNSDDFRELVFSLGGVSTAQRPDLGHFRTWPAPNIWGGVSVENQQWAAIRIPALLDTPFAVRFISAEPLLGPVDLDPWLRCQDCGQNHGLRWVIVGGESGPGARAMHPDWARSLRDQCVAADVPFLFKQWGESRPLQAGDRVPDRRVISVAREADGTWPSFQMRVGKKAAGRELDGRTWDQYPQVVG